MNEQKLGNREEQKEKMLEMYRIAKNINGKGCEDCFGRGFEGWDAVKGFYIPCDCITKAARKIRMEKIRNPVNKELNPESSN